MQSISDLASPTLPATMLGWTKVRGETDGFELIEHPTPSPAPDEVLVKTLSTSICGTDLHIFHWNEWYANEVPLGTITGHETCGIVVGLGQGVRSHQVGDFISVECHLVDWSCDRCAEGNAHICEHGSTFGVSSHGAFAPWFTIPWQNARHNPPGLATEHGSIQDPLGNAIHTLMGPDDLSVEGFAVAVHGCGPIGLFAVNAARQMGARLVIATDWDHWQRMEMAAELGADLVLGKEHDVVAEVLAATGGVGVDLSAEFSGAPAALSNAIKSTRLGGTVNILATYGSDPNVPVNDVSFRYLKLNGINGRKMWATWDAMQPLLVNQSIDVDRIITHRLPWAEFKEGIRLAQSGEAAKVVLDFD